MHNKPGPQFDRSTLMCAVAMTHHAATLQFAQNAISVLLSAGLRSGGAHPAEEWQKTLEERRRSWFRCFHPSYTRTFTHCILTGNMFSIDLNVVSPELCFPMSASEVLKVLQHQISLVWFATMCLLSWKRHIVLLYGGNEPMQENKWPLLAVACGWHHVFSNFYFV